MVTKAILLAYQKQNPSKFEHKFGHIDLDKYELEEVINEPKATTKLDGTPADPAVDLSKIPVEPQVPVAPVAPVVTEPTEPVVETKENAPVVKETKPNNKTKANGGDVSGGKNIKK